MQPRTKEKVKKTSQYSFSVRRQQQAQKLSDQTQTPPPVTVLKPSFKTHKFLCLSLSVTKRNQSVS